MSIKLTIQTTNTWNVAREMIENNEEVKIFKSESFEELDFCPTTDEDFVLCLVESLETGLRTYLYQYAHYAEQNNFRALTSNEAPFFKLQKLEDDETIEEMLCPKNGIPTIETNVAKIMLQKIIDNADDVYIDDIDVLIKVNCKAEYLERKYFCEMNDFDCSFCEMNPYENFSQEEIDELKSSFSLSDGKHMAMLWHIWKEAHNLLQKEEQTSKLSSKAMGLVQHLANEHKKKVAREEKHYRKVMGRSSHKND